MRITSTKPILSWALASSLLLAGGCASDDSSNHDDLGHEIETVSEFCDVFASTLCTSCDEGPEPECIDEVTSDCLRNSAERSPDTYDTDQAETCIREVMTLDCAQLPLNCDGNLAIASCDNYLDGRTDDVCSDA